ncbi:3-keto-disaccharide hydrolase [Aureibaculum conchae]|uniref:3-keto-disaccharide hydrolase n=1 Tax=Aureibaculum sp. 2308TA14-22 TaxID=3108392 RepID=UPI003394CC9D
MYRKLNLIIVISASLMVFSCKTKPEAEKSAPKTEDIVTENWVSLFNGKDLESWTPKIRGYEYGDNIHNTFRVENGVIKVSYDGYGDEFKNRFGHLYYKAPFSNYKLKIQYRFTGTQLKDGPGWATRNSGVMIHCEDPKKIAKDQKFPLCIEVQMLGGIKENASRATGNLCTPGTNVVMDDELVTAHCTNSSSETYYGDQWVNLEVEVHSDSLIIHKINDKEVLRYSKPQIGGADMDDYNAEFKNKIGDALKGGYISLQSESHPVEFRNIELLELED